MPNHYDIDIECEYCGRYIFTIYPDDDTKVSPEDRVCKSCKEKGLKPKEKKNEKLSNVQSKKQHRKWPI